MSEGVWPIGRVDVGQVNAFTGPRADAFRQQSGAGVGTAGVLVGTAGRGSRLYRLSAVNAGATAYFLQVFNKATVAVNADIPVYVQRLPASSEAIINLAEVGGIVCPLGMSVAISSTAGTLTLAVANDIAAYTAFFTQQT
jgi:hypothetical protein